MERGQSRVQKSSQKEQEERLGKICQLSQQQYTYKSSLEQSKTACDRFGFVTSFRASFTSRMFNFFGCLPFRCLILFQARFIGVLLLRELANFAQFSILFFLAILLNSALFFFPLDEGLLAIVFPE